MPLSDIAQVVKMANFMFYTAILWQKQQRKTGVQETGVQALDNKKNLQDDDKEKSGEKSSSSAVRKLSGP